MTIYYVDGLDGDDLNPGTSEGVGGAFATPGRASEVVVAGDKVYVKASVTYTQQHGANDAILELTIDGTSTAPISWEGYSVTPGDNGRVTFDASVQALTNVVDTVNTATYNLFKNFVFTGAAADGVDWAGVGGDFGLFENCVFSNNGGWGCQGDNDVTFVNCTFNNNGAGGADFDTAARYIKCLVHSNNGSGLVGGSGTLYLYCIAYNNGGNINLHCNSNRGLWIANTVDGDGIVGSVGCATDNAVNYAAVWLNNIVMDCDTGISDALLSGEGVDSRSLNFTDYNLLVSNTTNIAGITPGDNDLQSTTDPFTDSANRDYTLAAGSEAIDSGTDAADIT